MKIYCKYILCRMSNNNPDMASDDMSAKRKRVAISIRDKLDILNSLANGTTAKSLCSKYGLGLSTIYDLKRQKNKLLKFYGASDLPDLMATRKTLHLAKNVSVDQVLTEWIKQCNKDKIPLTRTQIIAQAKVFHEKLNITVPCEYSSGWYGKFKRRYGLFKMDDKNATDFEVAQEYLEELNKSDCDDSLTHAQANAPIKSEAIITDLDNTNKAKLLVIGRDEKQWKIHGRHNLLFVNDTTNQEPKILGFTVAEEEQESIVKCETFEPLDEESLNINNIDDLSNEMIDNEILNMVVNDSSDENTQQNIVTEEKVSVDRMISLSDEMINGMKQRSFITDEQILSMYNIRELFLKEKLEQKNYFNLHLATHKNKSKLNCIPSTISADILSQQKISSPL